MCSSVGENAPESLVRPRSGIEDCRISRRVRSRPVDSLAHRTGELSHGGRARRQTVLMHERPRRIGLEKRGRSRRAGSDGPKSEETIKWTGIQAPLLRARRRVSAPRTAYTRQPGRTIDAQADVPVIDFLLFSFRFFFFHYLFFLTKLAVEKYVRRAKNFC